MTSPPALVDTNGRLIALERQLASGGEGAVFTLPNNATLVAKVYHRPPTAQTVEKLTTMVRLANPPLLALAAWPMGLLYHARTRQLAGFVMPRLSDCQPIQHLYNPVQRLRCFPRAGWDFQVRAAVNLAAAFDEVHKIGCLVGDVNQSNIQVSIQALVRLIDCDSFQVRVNGKAYLCEVGVAHYIPPELQGKSLRGLVRTENHDGFGLAVLIYQLLFVGRHPYAGVYRGTGDPSFEQLIAEFRFAQGPAAHTWGMAPPPHTPTFADIPPELGSLFRRAFERGSEAGTRPRPAEWMAALKRLEQAIVECAADPGHKYWRGAQSCVWCRLADHGGPEYYFGVAGGVGTFAVDEAKLQDVLRRLRACGPFDFPYDRRRFGPPRSPEPEPLPEGLEDHRSTAVVLGVAAGLCVLALPLGLIHGAICVAGFLGALVFGIWLAIHLSLSPWHREYRRRRTARNNAQNDLDRIEEEWRQTVLRYRQAHSEWRRSLQRLISDCRELASQYQVEVQQLAANAEAMARIRHLRLHLIADADIPKIGAGRKQVLASNGIFTAADIDAGTILDIKGFGEVLTSHLLAWKEEVVRQFRFDPATAISPTEQRSIAVKFRNGQQHILAELGRQIGTMESLAPACRAALQKLIPELQRAVALYEQAEADLHVLDRNR
jgi:DNA-binding helix-hairpin-helix protein with protein kinase domain